MINNPDHGNEQEGCVTPPEVRGQALMVLLGLALFISVVLVLEKMVGPMPKWLSPLGYLLFIFIQLRSISRSLIMSFRTDKSSMNYQDAAELDQARFDDLFGIVMLIICTGMFVQSLYSSYWS